MGDVQLETNTACELFLKDVRHVPKMRFNFIYVKKLDDEGYINYLGDGKWKLCKCSLILDREKKVNTLYKTYVIVQGRCKCC